jgi:hypothetical protein
MKHRHLARAGFYTTKTQSGQTVPGKNQLLSFVMLLTYSVTMSFVYHLLNRVSV